MSKHRKPSILLTGASGRVGHAIRCGLSSAWNIHCYSRVEADGIRPLESLTASAFPKVDAIIHAAWSTLPVSAEGDPEAWERTDLPLLSHLTELYLAQPKPPLFIFLSTGAVYGQAPGNPSVETDTPQPIGQYAQGKLAAEDFLRNLSLPACILRISNLYGLRFDPAKPQGVIPRIIRSAFTAEKFTLWGSDTVKDYLYCADFLQALECIAANRLAGTWNIAAGRGTQLHELVDAVEAATGKSIHTKSIPHPDWDIPDNRIDPSKFMQKTDWSPEIGIHDGILREIGTWKENMQSR